MDMQDRTAPEIQFAVAESYKTIRTNLLFLLAGNTGCNTVTVSSPQSGDGKTTNAINIAIAFSQLGKRVLLIDADLRRPAVHKKLRIDNSAGLSGVLAGFTVADEAIVTVNASLDVLPAGSVPPNPSELLASAALGHMLNTLRLAYDYIIIDSPPVGIVSDALVIAPHTDGLLMIVREKTTVHADFEKALDNIKLSGVRLLGAVLNSSSAEQKYSGYNKVY